MNQRLKEQPANKLLLPDDKAKMYGIESLADAELIAVIIRNGSKGMNVTELSERILKNVGGTLGGLAASSTDMLRSLPGIGEVKLLQLTAVAELSRRIWRSKRPQGIMFRNSASVYEYFREDMRHADIEEVHIALLDVKCRLLRHTVLTRGTLRSSLVSPREVFLEALHSRAASFVLLHNHPSGDCTPSREDEKLTQTLVTLGETMQIPMLDHIIIGNPGYYSFKDDGKLHGVRRE
ncbi:MAG: DNA repair protein RadC [Lachnospiraceae bacterium]|nr:DNA repair protein RadC [Lachnospiraceae bacterium]